MLEDRACFEVGLDTPSICQKDLYKAVHMRGTDEQVGIGAVPALAVNFLGESVAFVVTIAFRCTCIPDKYKAGWAENTAHPALSRSL